MDSFTERILERARERQRKLLEYSSSDTTNTKSLSNPTISDNVYTTLKDPDNRKSHSTPAINATHTDNTKSSYATSTEIDTPNAYNINRTFITSDSNLNSNKNVSDSSPLKGSISEGNFTKLLRQNSSKLNISSEIPGSPQMQLKTLNIQKDNFNMEIKLCSMENVRIEVELQEEDDSNDEEVPQSKLEIGDSISNQPAIREDAKRKLQRLGKLYAGGDDADISSPIHRTEPEFSAESDSLKPAIIKQKGLEERENSKPLSKNCKGLEGLAALAKNIDQWEDDLSKAKPFITIHTENTGENKKIVLEKQTDQVVALPVKSNIVKRTEVASKTALFQSTASPTKSALPNDKDPALLSIAERKALFEKNMGVVPIPKAPISLPMPFHKQKSKSKTDISVSSPSKENKSFVPRLTSHSSTETTISKSVSTQSSSCSTKENNPGSLKSSTSNLKGPVKYTAPKPPIKSDTVDSPTHKVTPGKTGAIASKVAALFQNKSTISQQQIENDIREQRQKEMDILLNRFHKNKKMHDIKDIINHPSESESENEEVSETTAMISQKPLQIVRRPQGIPPPPPLPGNKRKSGERRYSEEDSIKVAAVLDDVKRIKVKGTKPGQLYPCLSDIEATTETETNTASSTPNNSSTEDNSYDSDIIDANTSFGREVLETVCKNTSQKRMYDVNPASDLSDILDDMDDYLDEAMAYGSPVKSGPTPPKQSRSISPDNESQSSSSCFQYKHEGSPQKGSPQKYNSEAQDFRTPSKVIFSRRSSELPTYVVDGDNVLPLKHTVSFYRKQQMQNSTTPVRQIIRQPVIEESPASITSVSSNEEDEVGNKIQSLMEDVTRQQIIISQTSQALNLCYATPEFTGSTEQVEAEKLLLLAIHRRAAAQREIERLSVPKSLHSQNSIDSNESFEKGSVTISNIILPLKRDYVRALNATGGKGHHVVCLVKCAGQVHPTKLVSTVATNDRNPNLELSIPGTIYLNDIYSNFIVQFEVYCLQAQEEMLPHEVKYHINNKKSHKSTPKKAKAESRLVMPPLESPGGPQVVRSPTFALMGCVVFSIQGINRKNWTLNNTPSMSPLEGIVEMRIKCTLKLSSLEHHGFLTMFKDVSGFGAWHRHWCLLKGHSLSYWKYPEEEKKQTPIGSIDLRSCITKQVGPVRRDICARLHTIMIETTRPAEPRDKDSLIMECRGDETIIRHLLSADTKEERIEWCTMFNKAIATVN